MQHLQTFCIAFRRLVHILSDVLQDKLRRCLPTSILDLKLCESPQFAAVARHYCWCTQLSSLPRL